MTENRKADWLARGLVSGLAVLIIVAIGVLLVRGWLVPPREVTAHAGHDHQGQATSFFSDLFKVYTPRQVCMSYEPPVIWLHLISDLMIGAAYYSIPLALVSFIRRRRDVAFHWMFWMFAAFILACGTTHFISAADLWRPQYRIEGLIKLVTAILSVATAIALWPLIPKAIGLPSPRQLENRVGERTAELADLNTALRREIDARRLAETDQARLAAIVESSEDAIIGKNLNGIVTSWNRAAERLFGYTAEEMIGQPLLRIFLEERRSEETDILARIARGQIVAPYETVRAGKGGRHIDTLITVSPIRDRAGTIIGASTIVRDITAQKQNAREREQLLANERAARAEAERANRLKDEFLATVSHELRTPLTAILGWSQILRRKPGTDLLEEGLQTIERNSRSQAKLIDDLLDMSRIISGKLRLEIAEVNLLNVIDDAIRTLEPAAIAKDIHLQRVVDPQLPVVSADPARLQQVVWNLLTNAIKFTPRGGRVQVFLERRESHLELSVKDTGEGIETEFLPYMFERFSQADSSTTRRHGGLGIGLAIVRHLVELHGGTVEAHSHGKNKGSTFTVRLPIRPVMTRSQSQLAASASVAGSPQNPALTFDGLQVLVVDDEVDSGAIVARILEDSGALVRIARTAAQAFEMIRSARPEVLLLDIGMPDEDGYSLLRRVRKLHPSEGGDVPAIAVTAFARAEDLQCAMLAGFQRHLAKPFEPSELITAVAKVTGRHNGQAAS